MTKRADPRKKAGKRPAKPRSKAPADGMTDEVRAMIVTRLACYDTVSDIHASLVDMGIDISPQAISRYNPYNATSNAAVKWRDLYDTTRAEFLKALTEEPIANRQFRLRKLHTIFDRHMQKGNLVMAASILEQAAKEVGNIYTNVTKVQGAPLPGQLMPTTTPDERRNMLADRLKEAVAARKPKQLTQH